jgi:hypothetical protein
MRTIVTTEPAEIVLGKTEKARLSIEVMDETGALFSTDDINVEATVGEVRKTNRTGNGKYLAEYIPPRTKYPQFALIKVESRKHGLFDVTPLLLFGATTIPMTTEPESSVMLKVGERDFGPQMSDVKGAVEVPILVPPGHERGKATVVDQFGNLTTKAIDLKPRRSPAHMAFTSADSVIADGMHRLELAVFCADNFGKPDQPARPEARAESGKVAYRGSPAPGLQVFDYSSGSVSDGADEIILSFPGARDKAGREERHGEHDRGRQVGRAHNAGRS